MSSSDDEKTPGAAGSKRTSPQSVLPGAKRSRTETLPKGQILKVKMHNFMTYTDATITPGSRLNLVLGPNGTGKSSLVNALCLGLGGNSNLLGRADNVRDFVRKGSSTGMTEIHLSSGQTRPIIITRHMSACDNKSKWLLNGREATLTEVKKTVADLKIQIDNLCQFLPQDKVVMFARLTPTELLKETEKAIGSGELFELHKELTERKIAQMDTSHSTAVLEAELARHKAANTGLERDVEKFERRQELLDQTEVLERKLPWVKYKEQKDNYGQVKERVTRAKATLENKKTELSGQQGPLRERHAQKEAKNAERKRARLDVKKIEDRLHAAFDRATAPAEEMDRVQQDLENVEEDATAHEARIAASEQKVASIEKQIEDIPQAPQRDSRREAELRREQAELQGQERSLRTEVDTKADEAASAQRELQRLQGKLKQVDSVKGRRLAALEERNRGITKASTWVAANQAQFRGRVYGPVMIEVEVANPLHASMLEQHVPMNQWLVFVTEHKEDQDMLIKVSREDRWEFKPSVSCFSDNAAASIPHPKGDASNFRRFGVDATLDEVFDAPPLVKHILKDEASIHETYVGGRDSNQHVEAFLSGSNGIRVMWTPDSQYRVTTSAYNAAARSQTVIPLRQAKLLKTGSRGGAERAELVAQIEEKQRELAQLAAEQQAADEAYTAGGVRLAKVRDEAKALLDTRQKHEKKVRDLNNRLRGENRSLDQLRRAASPREKEPKLRAQLDELAERATAALAEAAEATAAMWRQIKKESALALSFQQLDLMVAALKRVTSGQEAEIVRYTKLVQQAEALFNDERETLALKLAIAEEKTGAMSSELRQEFTAVEEHGSTSEEIAGAISELEARANDIVCSNPRVMQEYKERAEKIADLEGKLRDESEIMETRQTELEQLEERWLPELQRIVTKVNRTFSRVFAKIGCAGEVTLHDQEDDYDRYAINIKVKFREAEELQVLNAQRQSGGERSVSTILYLVALQDVAACPFRVVDEINQGMDPHNERKVFRELVSAATGEGTPQCFLLTPKLLPDLPFTPDVTVLQIMNGPHVPQLARNFNHASIIGNRQLIAAH